jgi:hypothetical protein
VYKCDSLVILFRTKLSLLVCSKFQQNGKPAAKDGRSSSVGTVIAKRKTRTRRVDKGKSGQALTTAVSGGFGGGILSRSNKQAFYSFGGTEWRL